MIHNGEIVEMSNMHGPVPDNGERFPRGESRLGAVKRHIRECETPLPESDIPIQSPIQLMMGSENTIDEDDDIAESVVLADHLHEQDLSDEDL